MVQSNSTELDSLQISREADHVVSLVLNRPRRKNALDRQLVRCLGSTLSALSNDETVRVVILSGAGGAFCSGADLTTIVSPEEGEFDERIEEFHHLIRSIVHASQPIIAVVDGPAVGFGADLALACDMRIFSSKGYIEESFAKVGLMPDGGGTLWLPRFLGPRAYEYLALGLRLDATHCLQNGIANRVAPPDSLAEAVKEVAQQLAAAAPLALKHIKKSARAIDRAALEETLSSEKEGQRRLIASADFQEGVQAFLQKRTADFRGK